MFFLSIIFYTAGFYDYDMVGEYKAHTWKGKKAPQFYLKAHSTQRYSIWFSCWYLYSEKVWWNSDSV